MEATRPSPQGGQSSKTLPQQGERTLDPSPDETQSPDRVTAEAMRLVIVNWELAGWWLHFTGRSQGGN